MNNADYHERVLKHKVTKYGKNTGHFNSWGERINYYWYECEEGCKFD